MHGKGGFSWHRLIGLTYIKTRIGRTIGIPLTRSGRQRKLGAVVMGGCGPVFMVLLALPVVLLLWLLVLVVKAVRFRGGRS